jgi:pantetheine-phosphate adenylyltransferase
VRIIAGSAGGRSLIGPPPGAATRPTSDKVREAVFNVLSPYVSQGRVLDLFAGTGALGIEALSRGASTATFVEADRKLCKTIKDNLTSVGFANRARIVAKDIRQAGSTLASMAPFDLVFLDPPYGLELEREAMDLLIRKELLAPDAMVVLEHSSRTPPSLSPLALGALEHDRSRVYGDTALTYYRARGESSEQSQTQLDTESSTMARIAIYPGSFDPMTNGHLDVIQRSLAMFDKLVIAVASNVRKQALFTVDERIALLREVIGDESRVEIDTFEGLLVHYAQRKGATALVRGLRAVADFEYEFEMASMNRRLAPSVETVFLMTDEKYFYVSSHLVKEVATLGGDIDSFVPKAVASKLKARLAERAG